MKSTEGVSRENHTRSSHKKAQEPQNDFTNAFVLFVYR